MQLIGTVQHFSYEKHPLYQKIVLNTEVVAFSDVDFPKRCFKKRPYIDIFLFEEQIQHIYIIQNMEQPVLKTFQ
jgi:hypothetical protein